MAYLLRGFRGIYQLLFLIVFTRTRNAMTIEKDGKIVSALQIVPHTMTYLGTEISVGYISGGVHDSGRKRARAYATTLARDIRGNGTA